MHCMAPVSSFSLHIPHGVIPYYSADTPSSSLRYLYTRVESILPAVRPNASGNMQPIAFIAQRRNWLASSCLSCEKMRFETGRGHTSNDGSLEWSAGSSGSYARLRYLLTSRSLPPLNKKPHHQPNANRQRSTILTAFHPRDVDLRLRAPLRL